MTKSDGTKYNCGVDINLTSSGQTECFNNDGTDANIKAKVCGPAGVYLASRCNGSTVTGCGTVNTKTGYAGETTNNPTVWAGQTGTHVRLEGTVDTPANWTPNPPGASEWVGQQYVSRPHPNPSYNRPLLLLRIKFPSAPCWIRAKEERSTGM